MKHFRLAMVILSMIFAFSSCAPAGVVGAPNSNSAEPYMQEYALLERLDATGIEAVRYIDDDSICISAYKKDAQGGRWELVLARYSPKSDDLNVFYRAVTSTDYLRNIRTAKLSDGREVIFNGATLFFLKDSKLLESITLEEAYRRETNVHFASKAMAMIQPETLSLQYLSDGMDEPRLVYAAAAKAEGKVVQMPYEPIISPSGNKILFQLVRGTAQSVYGLACYNIETDSMEFNIEFNQKSDVVHCLWLSDDQFFTWEGTDEDGGRTYITVYDALGTKLEAYSIGAAVVLLQAPANGTRAPFSALIFDANDQAREGLRFSLAVVDIVAKTATRIYQSETVVFGHDMSPNGEKTVWAEGEKIYEMNWQTADSIDYAITSL